VRLARPGNERNQYHAPCSNSPQVTDCDDAGFFLGVWQLGGALSAMSLLFSVVLLVYRFGVQVKEQNSQSGICRCHH